MHERCAREYVDTVLPPAVIVHALTRRDHWMSAVASYRLIALWSGYDAPGLLKKVWRRSRVVRLNFS